MKISFLAIGNELIQGKTGEANGRFLAQELDLLALEMKFMLLAGDNPEEMTNAFRFLGEHSEIIICSGGLGPTPDDLTTEVFAQFADLKLSLDPKILDQIQARFKIRGIEMPLTNKKQALIPESAKIIPNLFGTAPGFELEHNHRFWFFLPGVPNEFKQMTKDSLIPRILEIEKIKKATKSKTLRVYGITESGIADRLSGLKFDPKLRLAYLPEFPEIYLRLSVITEEKEDAEEIVKLASEMIKKELLEYVVSEQGEPLELVVGRLLKERGLTISAAESCTGGWLAKRITDIAGSSDYFLGGLVSYSNQMKIKELGVKEETIKKFGAVSRETAKQMAEGLRSKTSADIAIAITGIAGPSGGTKEKPIGTVYMALLDDKGIWEQRFQFLPLSRETVRSLATETGLEVIRRRILGLRMPGEKKNEQK